MPDWRNLIRRRLAELNLTAQAESVLADEMAQHLEDRYENLIALGAAPDDALDQVRAELRDIEPLRASTAAGRQSRHDSIPLGDSHARGPLSGFCRDIRYAVRGMRRRPVFVLFVVLTLALGMGANTTVFTVLNTLILNPLPARNPAQLAGLAGAEADPFKAGALFPISYPDLQDYQAQNAVFEWLAGYTSPRSVTLQEGSASEGFFAEFVSANYFATLGLVPSAGHFFSPDDDRPGANAVAVINHATWRTRFGAAPDIVGRTVRLNDVVCTIIAVAPRGFIGVNAIFGPDFWLSAASVERVFPAQMRHALRDRRQAIFSGVARYRPGITEARAQADVTAIAAALAHEYPATNEGRTAAVRPIRDAILATAGGGTSAQIVFAGTALMVVVSIVLLIACSNVANLLLARSAARRHEIAVRLAMGASRARLVRQLLTEAVALALLGGAAGLLLGFAGLRLLYSALPTAANFAAPKFDGMVFAYALVLSLATGVLFGIAPALRASRSDFADALRDAGRTLDRSRSGVSLSNILLVGQVAFSFVLLVSAALFLRSIGRAYQMDPGFQTAHLATFSTNAGQSGNTRVQIKAFYDEVRTRVARMPGIASVAWSANMPLWARSVSGIQIEGRSQRSQNDTVRAVLNTVDPAYFDTAGVTIRAGRAFSDADRDNSIPVAIVNETMAGVFWPAGALGRRVQLPGETRWRQIVGIARTASYTSWGEPPQSCVYVPLEQNPSDGMTLFIRTQGDPLPQIAPVEREIHAVAPQIVVTMPRTGRQIVDGGLFSARMGVIMLSIFGLLALAIASIGLYGILAYAATRRHREIGLRMALGATRSGILRLILRQGMSLVLIGLGLGFAASLFTGGLLSRLLFGVAATDPLSIAAAAAVLTLVALIACYLPAHWATRVDPLTALREE